MPAESDNLSGGEGSPPRNYGNFCGIKADFAASFEIIAHDLYLESSFWICSHLLSLCYSSGTAHCHGTT